MWVDAPSFIQGKESNGLVTTVASLDRPVFINILHYGYTPGHRILQGELKALDSRPDFASHARQWNMWNKIFSPVKCLLGQLPCLPHRDAKKTKWDNVHE